MAEKRRVDLAGMRFGRLTVVEFAGYAKNRKQMWHCICDCGGTTISEGGNLSSGKSKSCGCARRETCRAVGDRVRTHGMSKTSIYTVWSGIIDRCTNPNSKDFTRYGAAGITVCDRWRSFENFYADMGDRPKGRTIDRVDNAKGYEPGNCRWATPREQNINRTISRMVTIGDRTQCITDWIAESPVVESTIRRRLSMGMEMEKALFTPAGKVK